MTDQKTGFFLENFGTIGYVFTAFIVVSTALCGVVGALVETKNLKPVPSSGFFFGICAFLLGVAQIFEAFTKNYALLNLPTIISLLRTASIFCSGAAFCYLGVCILSKKSCDFKVISVSVVAWVFKVMSTFICFSGMSNISDNLYDLLALCVTLLFLLAHSKTLCGINSEKNKKLIFPLGSISVLVLITSVFPRIIATFFNNSNYIHQRIDSPLVSLFMILYIISYLLNISFSNEKNNI